MKLLIFPALTTLLLVALHWNSHFPVTYHQSPAPPVRTWIPTGIPALLDKAGTNAVPKESSSFGLTVQSWLPNTMLLFPLSGLQAPMFSIKIILNLTQLHQWS